MSMYYELLCNIKALPKTQETKDWRDWCMEISDALLDRGIELQRPTLVSDALYAHTISIVYDIPGGIWGKPADEISTLDVYERIMLRTPRELWIGLAVFDGWQEEPQEKLAQKFKDALRLRGADCVQWCIKLDIPMVFVKPWMETGAKLGCKKLVTEWLKMDAPWPIHPWQRLQLEIYR